MIFTIFPMPVKAIGKINPIVKKVYKPFPKIRTINNRGYSHVLNTNLSAISTIDSIKVSWEAIDGAISYDIEADGIVINVGLNNSYLHKGLKEGTVHTYRLRVNNAQGSDAWSKPFKFATKADVLHNNLTSSNSMNGIININNININATDRISVPGIPMDISSIAALNSITLLWRPVDYAAGYDIEIDGVVKDCGDKFTYVNSGLLPETSHTYRLRAKNSKGTGEWSNYIKQTTLAEPISAPQNIICKATTNSLTISWDKVNDAAGYDVEIDGKVHDNGIAISYTENSLMPGTAHACRVRAKKSSNTGIWSPIFVKSTLTDSETTNTRNQSTKTDNLKTMNTTANEIAAPANLTAESITSTTVNLKWTITSGDSSVAGYDIYNGTNKIGSTTGDSNYTVTGLTPNTTYTFTVVAKDSAGNISAASNALTVSTKDTQASTSPKNLTVTSITSTSVMLT